MPHNSSECCPPQSSANPSRPKHAHPVSDKSGYEQKGHYECIGEYEQVYVTGPDDAKQALVVVYDIFGFWDTTIQVRVGVYGIMLRN
ncbi:uncharacterized protein IL334_007096 [Kwoniella shivajii]|uniref:Dienelactone hydrolase domain-containing protein n=1 Tax=Kwoniella shivajii TaxID=564305 RepID=A0ABZ1D7R8_9TREE|nr:hypothetical protein IL334_007096 [Kwoniella shivajii]